jgi:hypothetical protein
VSYVSLSCFLRVYWQREKVETDEEGKSTRTKVVPWCIRFRV